MAKMKDKTVIVTGGGQGIGYGMVTAFAREGANLVITGRTKSKLDEAKAKLLEQFDVEILTVAADSSDEDAVKEVIAKTVDKFGQINVVINNADAAKSGLMLIEHTTEDFDLGVKVGLYGTFFFMKHAFPYLKETKGTVINFASGAGLFGKVGQSSYAATKEGIRGLSRVAATEWGEYGININVICPLAMTEGLEQWKIDYPEMYEKTIKGVPNGRFADADKDIGATCIFLATDGKFINGETITIQGGSGLRP